MMSQNKMAVAIWRTLIVLLYFGIEALARLVYPAYKGFKCELCTRIVLLYIYINV